jgi:hypothetical protein
MYVFLLTLNRNHDSRGCENSDIQLYLARSQASECSLPRWPVLSTKLGLHSVPVLSEWAVLSDDKLALMHILFSGIL